MTAAKKIGVSRAMASSLRSVSAFPDQVENELQVQNDDDCRDNSGQTCEPSWGDELSHLATIRGDHYQRHDGERKLEAENHLTQDQQFGGAALTKIHRRDDSRNDGHESGEKGLEATVQSAMLLE